MTEALVLFWLITIAYFAIVISKKLDTVIKILAEKNNEE